MSMITKKTWEEFQSAGFLWWVNRTLHLFGWAIVLEINEDKKVVDVYPARVKFRGFSQDVESTCFINLTEQLAKEIPELVIEVKE